MKLSYFDLLSPSPIQIQGVGGVISPTLRDISDIGHDTYQYYLSIIAMDLKSFFAITNQTEIYETLSEEEKAQLNVYDLIISTEEMSLLLQKALNFFIKEDVVFSKEYKSFFVKDIITVYENGSAVEKYDNVGMIIKEIYPQICDAICQRNYIKNNQEEDLSKIKSKKAMEIMKKLQKGRKEKAKSTKADINMELANIISAVANKSPSLNILNIWDLTIYQLWDCFSRLTNNSIYDIQSMQVAAWGDKESRFDVLAWYKRMDNGN